MNPYAQAAVNAALFGVNRDVIPPAAEEKLNLYMNPGMLAPIDQRSPMTIPSSAVNMPSREPFVMPPVDMPMGGAPSERALAEPSNFKEAFRMARKRGDSVFDWGGKKYTTDLKPPTQRKRYPGTENNPYELPEVITTAPAPNQRKRYPGTEDNPHELPEVITTAPRIRRENVHDRQFLGNR